MANPIGWLNVNNGYVLGAPVTATGTLVSASATVQLSSTVTAVQGAFVTAATLGHPAFLNAAVTNGSSIVLNGTVGVNATQAVTIWPFPVAIGVENSATIANGAALSSGTSGWRGTGVIVSSSDCVSAGSTIEAPLADIYFFAGGAVTPTAGASISGWFRRSLDGTNFESAVSTPGTTVAAMPRAPDFIIPLDAAALAANNIKLASGDVELPSGNFGVIIQNNAGVALPIGNGIIICPKQLTQ